MFYTDEVFARELDFEKQIDEQYDRALKRFRSIKASKFRITYSEAHRFDRVHPERLIGVVEHEDASDGN